MHACESIHSLINQAAVAAKDAADVLVVSAFADVDARPAHGALPHRAPSPQLHC